MKWKGGRGRATKRARKKRDRGTEKEKREMQRETQRERGIRWHAERQAYIRRER